MLKFLFILAAALCAQSLRADSPADYKLYFGNTHAHCNYSGDIAKFRAAKGLGLDSLNSADNHFREAKQNGYDFYCVTDHSQYDTFTAASWADTKAQAGKFTDATFVGICGYEHSENDGPDGTGHMNVYNTESYLSALAPKVSIEYFHNWLTLPEQAGAVVCFNHPQVNAYNNFHCYNPAVMSHIRVIELINGNGSKYPAFVNALSLGWKVSPVAGCDNHGWQGIAKWTVRTGLWAKNLTYDGIIDAMRTRRTYATYDRNLSVAYTVNGKMMGSEIKTAGAYKFDIRVSDPDTDDRQGVITRIEIVGENGNVVKTSEFDAHEVNWKVSVPKGQNYYYVLVYNAAGKHPVAYAAPVWIK